MQKFYRITKELSDFCGNAWIDPEFKPIYFCGTETEKEIYLKQLSKNSIVSSYISEEIELVKLGKQTSEKAFSMIFADSYDAAIFMKYMATMLYFVNVTFKSIILDGIWIHVEL